MSWAAIGAAAAGAVISAGASYAISSASTPDAPDLGSSSRELAEVNAKLLPMRRALEAAAKKGGKVTIPDYPAHTEKKPFYWVKGGTENEFDAGKNIQGLASMGVDPVAGTIMATLGANKKRTVWTAVPKEEWEKGGKYEGQDPPPWGGGEDWPFSYPAGPKTIDFTGYGEADANAVVARETAKAQLALQQKYGVQFAETAAEQQKLADPEGYAARQKMNELIQGQINRTPDRTMANTLDRQIGSQLDAGNNLDADSRAMLDEAVRQAGGARGGLDTPADFADPLTMGWAGQARKDAGIGKAQSWLASGATPQDAAYRNEQQNLSNLSALVNGSTPQSQFSNLSAPGPTPMVSGGAQPQMPNNASAGAANALNTYNAQINQQTSQTNDWMAGLAGLLSVGNAALKKTG
jgi:hypothetical protein